MQEVHHPQLVLEVDVHAAVQSQLIGAHQAGNAATAVTAALELQRQAFPNISPDTIARGLEAATLPGRFQVNRLSVQEPAF